MLEDWFVAARTGDTAHLRRHLAASAGHRDSRGRTALMHAAEAGMPDAVALLVSSEKMLTDNTGNCALSLAVLAGAFGAAQALVDSEAAFRYQCGRDCLMLAAEVSTLSMIALLAQHIGKNTDAYGQTVLSFAVRRGQAEIVEYLFQQFSFTEAELMSALHNFSGPNFVQISSLVYLQRQRIKSELCGNCQETTVQMLRAQQEVRRYENLFKMEQAQNNVIHVRLQALADRFNCSKHEILESIEKLIGFLLSHKAVALPETPKLLRCLSPDNFYNTFALSARHMHREASTSTDRQKREAFILKQQLEALFKEKGVLQDKLAKTERVLDTVRASLAARESALQEAAERERSLQAELAARQREIEEEGRSMSALRAENAALKKQLEVLLHRDTAVTKDGITPLIKSVLLGEFETALSFVDEYAGCVTAAGLAASHILLQSGRLNFKPVELTGYDQTMSKRRAKRPATGVLNIYSYSKRDEDAAPVACALYEGYVRRPANAPGPPSEGNAAYVGKREDKEMGRQMARMEEDFEPFLATRAHPRLIQAQIQIEVPMPHLDTRFTVSVEPMLSAADRHAVLLLEQLAEREAGVRTASNETALELAMRDGNLLAIDILAPHQARLATSRGNLPAFEAIKALAGLPKDAANQHSSNDEMDHGAERTKLASICSVLLTHSAGLRDDEETTPLMIAAQHNAYEIVNLLLETEAGKQNAYGDTALMIAVACGHTTVVHTLAPLEAGLINRDGISALKLAIMLQKEAEVRALLPYELFLCGSEDSLLLTVLRTHSVLLVLLFMEDLVVRAEADKRMDSSEIGLLDLIVDDVLSYNFNNAVAKAIRWMPHWKTLCTMQEANSN